MQKKEFGKRFGRVLITLVVVTALFTSAFVFFGGASATTTPGQNTVIFHESGLATGTSWSTDFNGNTHTSTTAYDNISVTANGSYDFSIIDPNGYTGSPSSGVVSITDYNIAGATNVTEPITFTPSAKTYSVTFYSGSYLTAGLVWSVTVNGVTHTSNTNTVAFNEPNGTYSFNIPDVGHWYAIPFSGTFTVAGNSNLPKWMGNTLQNNITFRYGYLVTFASSGLPAYVPWSVQFNGTTNSTTGSSSSITFSIANGTNYAYTVSIAPNWKVSPSSAKLNVSGAPITQTITFTELFFKVIFIETGLPTSTAWIIYVNGVPYPTTNGTVTLSEHNGTFAYTVESMPGYTASPTSGTVDLQYSDVATHIIYTAGTTVRSQTNGTGGGWTITGATNFFHTDIGYAVAIAIAVIAIVGIGIVSHQKGKETGLNLSKKRKKNLK